MRFSMAKQQRTAVKILMVAGMPTGRMENSLLTCRMTVAHAAFMLMSAHITLFRAASESSISKEVLC